MTFLWFKRGATAYEAQVGNWVLRLVHLRGEYWAWRPWRRVSLTRYPPEADNTCDLGMDCEQHGSCYAEYHGRPDMCGRRR